MMKPALTLACTLLAEASSSTSHRRLLRLPSDPRLPAPFPTDARFDVGEGWPEALREADLFVFRFLRASGSAGPSAPPSASPSAPPTRERYVLSNDDLGGKISRRPTPPPGPPAPAPAPTAAPVPSSTDATVGPASRPSASGGGDDDGGTTSSCKYGPGRRRLLLLLRLREVAVPPPGGGSAEALLLDESTPQGKAFRWIADGDEATLCPDGTPGGEGRRLVQRYVAAVLYYSTGGEGWEECHASDAACGTAAGSDGGGGRFRPGSRPFLSEESECDWAGLTCNSGGTITSIELCESAVCGSVCACRCG